MTTVPISIGEFSAATFRPLVGQEIPFLRPAGPGVQAETVPLTLLQITEGDAANREGFRDPFSLLFTLRDSAPLDDLNLHVLHHPDFEPCEILITRVYVPGLDKRDGTMFYEAVFA
jgi:hypothetical protein